MLGTYFDVTLIWEQTQTEHVLHRRRSVWRCHKVITSSLHHPAWHVWCRVCAAGLGRRILGQSRRAGVANRLFDTRVKSDFKLVQSAQFLLRQSIFQSAFLLHEWRRHRCHWLDLMFASNTPLCNYVSVHLTLPIHATHCPWGHRCPDPALGGDAPGHHLPSHPEHIPKIWQCIWEILWHVKIGCLI